MDVPELDLVGAALAGAKKLKTQFPEIEFTSGRRGVTDQARAMASNVVGVRDWITRTYRATPERAALQAWVNTHPNATTRAAIQAGLEGVMQHWTDEQKGKLSKHFNGMAFDIQPLPTSAKATAIKAAARALPGCKFLEKEGGLVRWHAQFS